MAASPNLPYCMMHGDGWLAMADHRVLSTQKPGLSRIHNKSLRHYTDTELSDAVY